MKIKEAVYDKGCSKCGAGKKLIKDEVYGCDHCKEVISSPCDDKRTYLEVTVFYSGIRDAEHLHFCSWQCVFKFLGKIQKTKYRSDYFVSLPIIKFNGDKPGYKDFMKDLRGARRNVV